MSSNANWVAKVAKANVAEALALMDIRKSAKLTDKILSARRVRKDTRNMNVVIRADVLADIKAKKLNKDKIAAMDDAKYSPAENRGIRSEYRSVLNWKIRYHIR